jgi:hypothetical protein
MMMAQVLMIFVTVGMATGDNVADNYVYCRDDIAKNTDHCHDVDDYNGDFVDNDNFYCDDINVNMHAAL